MLERSCSPQGRRAYFRPSWPGTYTAWHPAHRAEKWIRISAPNDAPLSGLSIGSIPKVETTFGSDALEFLMTEFAEMEAELARLKQEHRDLDMAIDALESMVAGDQLQVQRLKKRKLSLKDQIIRLEDQLTPDIIA
jgi:hypothetical protein